MFDQHPVIITSHNQIVDQNPCVYIPRVGDFQILRPEGIIRVGQVKRIAEGHCEISDWHVSAPVGARTAIEVE